MKIKLLLLTISSIVSISASAPKADDQSQSTKPMVATTATISTVSQSASCPIPDTNQLQTIDKADNEISVVSKVKVSDDQRHNLATVFSLAVLSKDQIISGSLFGIHRWRVPENSLIQSMNCDSTVSCLAVLDNDTIASGHFDGSIKIWKLVNDSFQFVKDYNIDLSKVGAAKTQYNGTVWELARLNNQLFISAGTEGTIKIWNKESDAIKPQLIIINKTSPIVSMAPLAQTAIASGGAKGIVRIWDINKKVPTNMFSHGNTSVCRIVEVSDGVVASGGHDGIIKLWDTRSKSIRPIKKLNHNIHNNYGPYYDGDPDKYKWRINFLKTLPNALVSAGEDGKIQIWDVRNSSMEPLKTIIPGKRRVQSLETFEDTIISGGDNDSRIKIWHNPVASALGTAIKASNSVISSAATSIVSSADSKDEKEPKK